MPCWRAAIIQGESVLTSQQAADYVFLRPHALAVIKVIVCASDSLVFMLTWTLKARSSYHHAYATPCVDSTRISILLLCMLWQATA